MTFINLKFDNIEEPIVITVENNINAQAFANDINNLTAPANYVTQKMQSNKNIVDDFVKQATRGNELFNFNWDLVNLTQNNFNLMHRDIENFNINNYPELDCSIEDFFIKLHKALHQAETSILDPSTAKQIPTQVQVKWYGDSKPWPETPTFINQSQLRPGDVIADYPHVGKTPLTCMQHNDTSDLETMCKIPDAYPPSLRIILNNNLTVAMDDNLKNKLALWYDQHIDKLSAKFTKEQMLNHYGEFKIGSISLEQVELLKYIQVSACSAVEVF